MVKEKIIQMLESFDKRISSLNDHEQYIEFLINKESIICVIFDNL